jgi:hypothetical protein
MIAAHTQRLYIAPRTTDARHPRLGDLVQRAVTRTRQVVCGLSGHSMLLHFEGDHMSLRCFACGMQTPGWTIDVRQQFRQSTHPRRSMRIVRRAA